MYALLVYRIFSAAWILVLFISDAARIASEAGTPGGSFTARQSGFPVAYTLWCFWLLPFYFIFATVSSIMYLRSDDTTDESKQHGVNERSQTAVVLRTIHWGLLEICLPSAWLVTIVVFLLLDPFQLRIIWNGVSHMHFWNSVAITIDFSVGRLPVRAGHFVLMMGWILLYVTYSWAMKASSWYRFVYWFQSLETPLALMWYPLLALLHVIIYFAFVGFTGCKEKRADRGGCCCPCLFGAASSMRHIPSEVSEEAAP